MKIREEVQEYPDKSLGEAFMDKIKEIEDRESKEDMQEDRSIVGFIVIVVILL